MSDPRDQGMVALALGPVDCPILSLERRKDVVCAIFDHVVLDPLTFGPTFWTGFNVDVGHAFLPSPKTASKAVYLGQATLRLSADDLPVLPGTRS